MVSDRDYEGSEALEILSEARNYNDALVSLISNCVSSNSVVLDYGAGDGTIASMVSTMVRETHAFEPDPKLRALIPGKGNIEIVRSLSLNRRRYDLIFLVNVLEHIEYDFELLTELKPHLAEEGRILIYVPASPKLFSDFDRAVGHFRRYTSSGLHSSLVSAGLKVERIEYADPLGWFVAWAHKKFRMSSQISRHQVWVFDRVIFPISWKLNPVFKHAFGKNLIAVARL